MFSTGGAKASVAPWTNGCHGIYSSCHLPTDTDSEPPVYGIEAGECSMTAPDIIAERFPLVTSEISVGGRTWRVTAVQNQDALVEAVDTLEHMPYGFLLWESAVGLAQLLAEEPERVAGKRVLELGCGVGFPGMVARWLRADIWQTDHQRGALKLAEQNALQNAV